MKTWDDMETDFARGWEAGRDDEAKRSRLWARVEGAVTALSVAIAVIVFADLVSMWSGL